MELFVCKIQGCRNIFRHINIGLVKFGLFDKRIAADCKVHGIKKALDLLMNPPLQYHALVERNYSDKFDSFWENIGDEKENVSQYLISLLDATETDKKEDMMCLSHSITWTD